MRLLSWACPVLAQCDHVRIDLPRARDNDLDERQRRTRLCSAGFYCRPFTGPTNGELDLFRDSGSGFGIQRRRYLSGLMA
jgi:hypothetical protein